MKLGTNDVDNVMLGDTQVDKIYLGTELAWEAGGGTPNYFTDDTNGEVVGEEVLLDGSVDAVLYSSNSTTPTLNSAVEYRLNGTDAVFKTPALPVGIRYRLYFRFNISTSQVVPDPRDAYIKPFVVISGNIVSQVLKVDNVETTYYQPSGLHFTGELVEYEVVVDMVENLWIHAEITEWGQSSGADFKLLASNFLMTWEEVSGS